MKKQSIRSYLFRTVLITLAFISLLIGIINMLVTVGVQNEFIYHELEEAMNGFDPIVKFEDQLRHVVSFEWNEKSGQIKVRSLKNEYNFVTEDFQLIVDDFIQHGEDEGQFRFRSSMIYYVVEENKTGYTFYFVDIHGRTIGKEFIVLIIIVLITVFIASKRISNYISKPLDSLSSFSEEVAKKNWQAELEPIPNLELSRLGESLIEMKSQLEIADMEERQFLQATSHDLKTPIMVIKGYSQAMIDHMPIEGDLSPEQVILKEAERLERKVHQLVRLNTVGYSLEHASHEIVRVDRILRALIEKFKVVTDLDIISQLEPLECYGDGDSLLIAFENIVENQLRYAETTIFISIVGSVVTIENDGPHFTEDPESLFEIYKKGKSGQYGLGLAITKKVIQGHKGSIRAYNKDQGVCFEIEITKAEN
ncbi:HAMP domain-containing histidine kinase [Acidaminobacter sp. JC074]|uniref:sensor histidine kinase n=1 Tax=Acidaminobacter sp. JC074 TaxID=2530199 RepID=UPI001F11334C|nr:HAMP domain-containing sensor histidine kinase [Acidaminobacter sp. JC074]MCH4886688.1 HAMP domain-containing histidine kinase [Acidaminobacter sp. JC074]